MGRVQDSPNSNNKAYGFFFCWVSVYTGNRTPELLDHKETEYHQARRFGGRPMGFELSTFGPKGFIDNNLLISIEEDAHTMKALKLTSKSFDYI